MKIFLDTADVSLIRPAYETGLIDGVTTNPTLILKSGRQLKDVIQEISDSFPALESISAEVVGDTAGEMRKQVDDYFKYEFVGDRVDNWVNCISLAVTIKLPCTTEGLKLCKELHLTEIGIQTNVTLVFSVAQAILAAKAGATYISPFVGRWMDNSVDGIELIRNIREVYDRHNIKTKILAASVRDVRQVELCAKYGADIVTIPPTVFWSMYKNVLTEKGLEQFQKDWNEVLSSNEK
jgi:transaldolase